MAQQNIRIFTGPSDFDLMKSLFERNEAFRLPISFGLKTEDGQKTTEQFYIDGLERGDPSIPTQWVFKVTHLVFLDGKIDHKYKKVGTATGTYQTFNRVGWLKFNQ